MSELAVAVILGSTRPGRAGAAVADWVLDSGRNHGGADYTLLDLASFDLGLLAEPVVPGAAKRQYQNPQTRIWGQAVDSYDAFVFVTPEYNHGVPAAFKNAVDLIYPEWNDKAVGFVSYGADGGVRAVEHWRQIVANVHLHAVRAQVSLSMFADWTDGAFTPQPRRTGELETLWTQLLPLAELMRTRRG